MENTTHSNRRKYKRVHFIKDILLEGVVAARSSDISAGGIYIETVAGFKTGVNVVLQFKLNDSDEHPIKGQALIRYVHEGVGMGLAFTELSIDDCKKIEMFVGQHY